MPEQRMMASPHRHASAKPQWDFGRARYVSADRPKSFRSVTFQQPKPALRDAVITLHVLGDIYTTMEREFHLSVLTDLDVDERFSTLVPGANVREAESSKADVVQSLKQRISLLESQLKSEQLHLQLYRYGAGALSLSVGSLGMWGLTGISAPLHPVFAALTVPVSVIIMIMAFLAKKHPRQDAKQ